MLIAEQPYGTIHTGDFMKNDIHLKIIILSLLLIAISFISPSPLFAAQIRLAWDANQEGDLAGYWVHYGNISRTHSGGYQNSVDVGNATTYTLTDIDPYKTYYIAVTAYDTFNNNSDYSNEVRRLSFLDVPEGYWAYDSVIVISDTGITLGCQPDNIATINTEAEFCPIDNTTREQMAAFIVRAVEGEPDPSYCTGDPPFNDVPVTSSFCKYIKRLSELGITQGCGPNLYCPSSSVPREQMDAFIVRAVSGGQNFEGPCAGQSPFSDVPESSPFCRNIEQLVALGITQGCLPGMYCPSGNVLRDQMAAFITRAFPGIP